MTNELKLFFNNFDKLAESPGGVQKLRELILQLAVQGKLVPQDPNDEPASELLKKIKAEKEKLIKEGKIKKQKALPPIEPDEVPYKLPTGWEFCRLGKIINISSGNALPSYKMAKDGRIPVFGGNGITGYHDKYNIVKRTLVIGRVGFYCGSVHITPVTAWITDNAFKTYFDESSINLIFMYWLLKATDLGQNDNATAQPVISGRKVYPLVVGLPPLSEQKRIVKKVDELMALCDELEAKQEKTSHGRIVLNSSAIDHLLNAETTKDFAKFWQLICDNFELLYNDPQNVNKLRQAVLQLAVQGKLVPQDPKDKPASELLKKIKAEKEKLIKDGKVRKQKPLPPITEDEIPYEIPTGWIWVRLLDVFDVRDGTHDTPKYQPKGIPLVTSKNLSSGKLDLTNIKYISIEDHKKISERSKVNLNDILFAMIGSIGNPVIVDRDIEFSIKNVALFKYYSKQHSVPPFLHLFLLHAVTKMREQAAGGVQSFVSLTYLRKYTFPLPPLAEQKRIVKKVDELMVLCDEVEEKIKQSQDKSEKLIAATIHHLLVA